MAHCAELDGSNTVLRVVVVDDAITDPAGWCAGFLGGRWVETDITGSKRKNYAGPGFTYDAARDAFLPPKPFTSWVLDETTCRWKPPIPAPVGQRVQWSEVARNWVPKPPRAK